MSGEAGLRKIVRVERGIGRVVMYRVPPISELVEQSPTMRVHGSFCEKEKVRGMLVQQRNDVCQGGVVSPHFLYVDGDKCEPEGRKGRVWVMAGGCGLLCLGRGRKVRRGKIRGESLSAMTLRGAKYGRGRQTAVYILRGRAWARTGWGSRMWVWDRVWGPRCGVVTYPIRRVSLPSENVKAPREKRKGRKVFTADREKIRAKVRPVVREHGLVKALVRPDAGRVKVFGRRCAT